ncbi:MAG: hypothetical protein AAGC63_10945 [Propionicimonas sp.]
MIEWFERWLKESFVNNEPPDYDLPDPDLKAYDHGVGTLRVDGELKGYLASVRLTMTFPARQWWPWFVIVWTDERKERSFEDYGPKWYTVRELDAGSLDHHGPSVPRSKTVLGRSFHYDEDGEPQVYEFAWLPPDEAAAKWRELGLSDDDF